MAAALRNDPHARQFGVEIECGMNGGTSAAYDALGFGRRCPTGWSIGADGSGVEVRTPKLRGKEGYAILRETMEKLRAAGAFVTESDGMHVHHDAPEFKASPGYCLQIVRSWRNNQAAIYNMVAPRRRSYNGPAPSWNNETFHSLEEWAKGKGDPRDLYVGRHDLNLSALRHYGSIEIRLHEGTLDPDVAIAWVMFGQKFISDVLKRAKPIAATASDETLMSRIKLSKKARKTLTAKRLREHVTEATAWRTQSSAW